mmetsp:Transcript_91173/g.260381  ORF Transcript_91173/g.260381 Transcript_91173/m.260381 type:complete len:238 (+) Transcript_91173:1014-1727(+)
MRAGAGHRAPAPDVKYEKSRGTRSRRRPLLLVAQPGDVYSAACYVQPPRPPSHKPSRASPQHWLYTTDPGCSMAPYPQPQRSVDWHKNGRAWMQYSTETVANACAQHKNTSSDDDRLPLKRLRKGSPCRDWTVIAATSTTISTASAFSMLPISRPKASSWGSHSLYPRSKNARCLKNMSRAPATMMMAVISEHIDATLSIHTTARKLAFSSMGTCVRPRMRWNKAWHGKNVTRLTSS